MRRPLIAGNWKMNKTVDESTALAGELLLALKNSDDRADILICPPFTSLYPVHQVIKDSKIKLGAQNMYFEQNGAYTGEISADMLKNAGAEYVILGHSERRQYFGDTDEIVNKKLRASISSDIKAILCVGESLSERENKEEKTKVRSQLVKAFEGISEHNAKGIVIAYEPIWAIGTGKTATSAQAGEMASFIRETVKDIYGEDAAGSVRILYGGSVKGSNISEIMSQKDVDGVLVGGASLKADEFSKIVNY